MHIFNPYELKIFLQFGGMNLNSLFPHVLYPDLLYLHVLYPDVMYHNVLHPDALFDTVS